MTIHSGKNTFFAVVAVAALLAAKAALAEPELKCGVVTEPADWNGTDPHGDLAPLDLAVCRAMAAALSAQADRLAVQSYATEQEALLGVERGRSDMVAGVTPGPGKEASFGVRFSQPFFADAQVIMVHRAEGIRTVADITGRKICTLDGTETQQAALAWLVTRSIRPISFGFQEQGEMEAAILDRHCEATSGYMSGLAATRAMARTPSAYVFLHDMIALAPVSVAIDAANPRLAHVADAVITVLLEAEFLGIGNGTMPGGASSADPRVRHVLDEDGSVARVLALRPSWPRAVLAVGGNYADIYDTTIGPGTALSLDRGVNALWDRGGLLAPLPLP